MCPFTHHTPCKTQQTYGRSITRFPGGSLGVAHRREQLHVCVPVQASDPTCVGHVGYTWQGQHWCYINAGGRNCTVETDDGIHFFMVGCVIPFVSYAKIHALHLNTQNLTILEWQPPTAPVTQYAYTQQLPATGKGFAHSAATTITPCRARIGSEVLIGEVVIPQPRIDASRERCHVYHPTYGLRSEKRFDVLTIQMPDIGATACTAHCQGLLNVTFSDTTDVYAGRLLAADAGSCCALCRATHGCVAFVYHRDGSARCELKAYVTKEAQARVANLNQCATEILSALTVGGVVRPTAMLDTDHCIPMHSIHANRVYAKPEGGLYSIVSAMSLADCCHKCKEHLKCRTFSFHNVLQVCSLHYATSDAVSNLQYVSGVLRK